MLSNNRRKFLTKLSIKIPVRSTNDVIQSQRAQNLQEYSPVDPKFTDQSTTSEPYPVKLEPVVKEEPFFPMDSRPEYASPFTNMLQHYTDSPQFSPTLSNYSPSDPQYTPLYPIESPTPVYTPPTTFDSDLDEFKKISSDLEEMLGMKRINSINLLDQFNTGELTPHEFDRISKEYESFEENVREKTSRIEQLFTNTLF